MPGEDAWYESAYAQSMTTTIKVSVDLRDRLKQQAAREGRTLGEQIEHLLALGDRAARFDALRSAIAATPAEKLESYADEVRDWESVDR